MPVEEVAPDTPLTRIQCDRMWQGDELMDGVVDWFQEAGASHGRRLLEAAIEHGIDTVPDAPPALARLFDDLDRRPEWLDVELAERGRLLIANASAHGKFVERIQNELITAMGAEVSMATGATGRIQRQPVRRLQETSRWFHSITIPGALEREHEVFKDTVRVRLMHCQIRRVLRDRWGDEAFALLGNPVSNTGTAQGVATFGLTSLLFDHRMGRRHSEEDLDAAAMYWAWIVWLLGAEEEAIAKTGRDALEVGDWVLNRMGAPSEWSETIARAVDELGNMMLLQSDRKLVQTAMTRLVVPLTYGLRALVMGDALTRRMLAATDRPAYNLDRWRRAAWATAKAELGWMRLRDQRGKTVDASEGDPFTVFLVAQTEAVAEKHRMPTPDFRAHDDTNTADVGGTSPDVA
jgi:hypothetical protein